eukprot:TRINITY_DN8379_c0_g1_i1.p1 TRINITY_DN8379_c0_g1~~TRINITY_DN8379_c0_g1_i1.p1  ORF type:complete len:701 (+),score=98.94 TRINITY_DN8379_c0_g1_i1:35-2104(+)
MATIGACFVALNSSPTLRPKCSSLAGKPKSTPIQAPRAVLSAEKTPSTLSENGRFEKKSPPIETPRKGLDDSVIELRSIRDYFELSKDLVRSDSGPPRWFSPLECGSRCKDSPLLLFLPGLDGVGLGLILHHQRLGKIFDIWCLHIPIMDRTPFEGLVDLVERTVKSEHSHSSYRPIYLVGESLGGCLGLAVAARNPDIDLVLILANPATSFNKSQLQYLLPVLDVVPEQLHVSIPYILSLITGDPLRMAMSSVEKGLPLQHTIGELSESLAAMLTYLPVLADIFPKESLLWKLRMLRSASSFANSRLHAVKAQTLVLASGKDQLLPSQEEAERLRNALPNCRIRHFKDNGHTIFLEDGVDLVTIVKGASFYRRSRKLDYVSDFQPPSSNELAQAYEQYRWLDLAASPVMLSTLEDGKVVRGLAGIPSEGPVVFVGYHTLMGFEVGPIVSELLSKRNILVRGIAHPFMFDKLADTLLPEPSSFDHVRLMGAVPASPTNFYKLLSRKSFVLLYPGGVREALHRKGEKYKLFWPGQSEFVRMAARFGATIVPFGAVGEDDIFEMFLDYEDFMRIPFLKDNIAELNKDYARLRTDDPGEVSKQDLHMPGILPKFPGRYYFLFGKPIETKGRQEELRDKEKAHELYLHVKSEVESCIDYLRERREKDPYRNLLPRLLYQATHGFESKVPTFEL